MKISYSWPLQPFTFQTITFAQYPVSNKASYVPEHILTYTHIHTRPGKGFLETHVEIVRATPGMTILPWAQRFGASFGCRARSRFRVRAH